MGQPAGDPLSALVVRTEDRSRAAGIYGTIITAAVLASSGPRLPTDDLVASVVVTLLIYWVAEQYAELLGTHLGGGRVPTWHDVRAALASTWPMVSASFLPLLFLVLAWEAGASEQVAANVGLIVAVGLMILYAWLAGRAAQVRGLRLVIIAAVAAGLGLLMIVLKDIVILHLH
jgi:hypothetical protein